MVLLTYLLVAVALLRGLGLPALVGSTAPLAELATVWAALDDGPEED